MDHQSTILEKEEITASNVQSMIKELNKGKLPDQLKFFSAEEKEKNLLKTKARQNVSVLSKGNKIFLEYQNMAETFFKKINLKLIWEVVKYIRIIFILGRAYTIS